MANWGESVVRDIAVKGGRAGKLPFMGTLGLDTALDLISVSHGQTVLAWQAASKLVSMDKIIQGGTMSVVADICQGHTFMSSLEAFEGFSTTDLEMRFIKPVYAGEAITITSHISMSTDRLTLIDTNFADETGDIRATAHGGWRRVKRAFAKAS